MDTLGIDSEDSASLAKRKLERNVKDMQDFSDLLRDNDPLNENSTENPNLIQQKCETEDRYGDNPRKYDVLCEIYSNLGDSSATMKGLQAQVLKLMAAETKIRAGEKKEIVGYKNKIHFLKETLNRKEEEFQVVREKLDKKRSELNRLKVFKRDKLATVDKMLTDLEAFLEHYKELLKFKNERISEDEKRSVAHQILEQEFASVKQELDAYRKAPKLEQNDLDLASGHEKHVFNPWRKEISELRAKASSAEDASARLRDQLEALNIKYKKCKEKYAILKERTKEHHEGLDHETNEYAKTVLKRNYEYQSILDESSLDESIIVKKKVTGRDNKRRTTKILQEPQVHESETVEILKKLNAASPSQ